MTTVQAIKKLAITDIIDFNGIHYKVNDITRYHIFIEGDQKILKKKVKEINDHFDPCPIQMKQNGVAKILKRIP